MAQRHRIKLTPEELTLAAYIGVFRRVYKIKEKLDDNYEMKSSSFGWQNSIVGAIGEYVVRKYLKLQWTAINELYDKDKGYDVASYQVRTTSYKNGKLVIRSIDNEDDKYILVTGCGFVYNICGWAFGRDVKKDKYLYKENGRPPCWMMPQKDLKEMRLL